MTLPRALVFRIVRRALVIWVVARLALGMLAIVWLTPLGVAAFAILVATLSWLDLKATGEAILYGNLGVSPSWVVLPAIVVALTMETVLGRIIAAFMAGPPPDPLL